MTTLVPMGGSHECDREAKIWGAKCAAATVSGIAALTGGIFLMLWALDDNGTPLPGADPIDNTTLA